MSLPANPDIKMAVMEETNWEAVRAIYLGALPAVTQCASGSLVVGFQTG